MACSTPMNWVGLFVQNVYRKEREPLQQLTMNSSNSMQLPMSPIQLYLQCAQQKVKQTIIIYLGEEEEQEKQLRQLCMTETCSYSQLQLISYIAIYLFRGSHSCSMSMKHNHLEGIQRDVDHYFSFSLVLGTLHGSQLQLDIALCACLYYYQGSRWEMRDRGSR